MLRKFISDRFYCGLDIGGQTIKASAVKIRENDKPGLLGVYEHKTNGFRNASVSDLGELSECIHTVLSHLSKKTGIKFKDVQLGIGGELIEKRLSAAVIPLLDRGNKVIANRDVKKVLGQARLLGANMEEAILHDFPQYYKIDDVNTAHNPIGLYGRKLEVHTLLIVANNTIVKNLTKAVHQAGYDVANLVFTSFASAKATLPEKAMQEGCILLDIGGAMTDCLMFKDGALTYLENIPIGGLQVTQRITSDLNLPQDLAEDIKKSYANALRSHPGSEEEILIKRDEGYLPVKKENISHSIEPVVADLIQAIKMVMDRSAIAHQLSHGIIMTGGGSLLPGLPERIEQETNLPVKMGKVHMTVRRMANAAKYASAIGLAQTALNESLGSGSNGYSNRAAYIVSKVKELYHEYF